MSLFERNVGPKDSNIQTYPVDQDPVKEILIPNNRITKLGVTIILGGSVAIMGFCFGLNPLSLAAGLVLGASICVAAFACKHRKIIHIAATVFEHKPIDQESKEEESESTPSKSIVPNLANTTPEASSENTVDDGRKSNEASQSAPVDLPVNLDMIDGPVQCPLSKDLIQSSAIDSSVIETLSETGKQVLQSLKTMEEIIGQSIAKLPLYPKIISDGNDLWDLKNSEYMNEIKAPISLGYCTAGWPCIIIKVLEDANRSMARSIYLFTGPQGSHYIKWFGWKDGVSCFRLFSGIGLQEGFIDKEGNLVGGESNQKEVQNLRNLLQGGVAIDTQGNKWVLASTPSSS